MSVRLIRFVSQSSIAKAHRIQEFADDVPVLQVDILGGPSLLVHSGSSLQLECLTSHVLRPPQFVMWQHGTLLTPGTTHTFTSNMGLVTKSVLTIEEVNKNTAGEYRCLPDNISPATININIIKNEEEQLAVTNKTPQRTQQSVALFLVLTVISLQQAVNYLAS